MSGAAPWPSGFCAHMKWSFEGNIPDKVWKQFRTKFSKEHAAGWDVKKLFQKWGRGQVVVSFHTTDPDVARTMTTEQWEFLRATISLLTVRT